MVMTLEDFKDVYKDASTLTKLNLLMETQSRRSDAQAIAATERWNENIEAENHWVNEHRSASAKAIWLFEEIKEALKAQPPRVLDYGEIQTMSNADVYLEDRKSDLIYPLMLLGAENSNKAQTVFFHPMIVRRLRTYNKTWRCWTKRPTEEQREAKPWED